MWVVEIVLLTVLRRVEHRRQGVETPSNGNFKIMARLRVELYAARQAKFEHELLRYRVKIRDITPNKVFIFLLPRTYDLHTNLHKRHDQSSVYLTSSIFNNGVPCISLKQVKVLLFSFLKCILRQYVECVSYSLFRWKRNFIAFSLLKC